MKILKPRLVLLVSLVLVLVLGILPAAAQDETTLVVWDNWCSIHMRTLG